MVRFPVGANDVFLSFFLCEECGRSVGSMHPLIRYVYLVTRASHLAKEAGANV